MHSLHVLLSPHEPLPVADVWLVVDILRATTTITTFFERGGRLLMPVCTVEEARALQAEDPSRLLMGERNALPPEGFDMGNSPRELERERLRNSPQAVMTTTNGTLALARVASEGVPVLAACARNAGAVVGKALSLGERIGILCAGRYGRQALDDTACAGLLADFFRGFAPAIALDDSSRLALTYWREGEGNLEFLVRQAAHAGILDEAGLGGDIPFCCAVDQTGIVPILGNFRGRSAFLSPSTDSGRSGP